MKTALKPPFAAALVIAAACSQANVGWQRTGPSSASPAIPLSKGLLESGSWAPLADYAADFYSDGPDGTRRSVASGVRLVKTADGAVEHSYDFVAVDSMRVIDLPERVGGGHLFAGERNGETFLWRADTWTAPLLPLASISERIEAIVVGFDRLYLELPSLRRWVAIDLETGAAAGLEPLPPASGYSSMAFVDAWFGAVSADLVGVLVTFDAGASWRQLEGVGKRSTVSARGESILIENDTEQWQLGVDGKLRRQASSGGQELFQELAEQQFGVAPEGEEPPPAVRAPLLAQPLRDAVLSGWPTRDGHALVLTEGALALVRLDDGSVTRLEQDAYPGEEPCQAVALGEGVGFVCSQARRGTTLLRFEQPFGLALVRRFLNHRIVRSMGNGALVISGDCAEAGSGVGPGYCFLHRDGSFDELRVRGDVGVERVAALADKSVVVLVPPRLGAPGTLTRVVAGKQTSVELKLPEEASAFLQTGLWLDPLTELAPGVVGTWVAGSRGYHGVTVALDGAVTDHPAVTGANLGRAVFHGPVAFEVTPSGVVWLSTDFGKVWTKRDAPPSFYPLDERTSLATLGPEPRVGCSNVGCAYGAWLHIGYPRASAADKDGKEPGSSEPRLAGAADAGAASAADGELVEAELPKRVSFNPVSYFEWRPTCHATGTVGKGGAELGERLNQLANERPRRGVRSGFLQPLLVQNPSDAGGAVFRPFMGMPGPSVSRAGVRFDEGKDGFLGFRAYAWAPSAADWGNNATWQVRVQTSFDLDGAWATAPTFAPWPDVNSAAELFGTRDHGRSSTDWALELDPDQEGGILRIGTGLSTELHVVGKGRATQSFRGAGSGALQGAVRSAGEWYFGQRDGEEFRVFHVATQGPVQVASFDTPHMHALTLVKSHDAARLGVLVQTITGAWYLYPLDAQFAPGEPLFVSREQLNRTPQRCEDGESGWVAVARLPLTRLDTSRDSNLLAFPGEAGLRADGAHAKVLVRDGSVCVSELGAVVVRRDREDLGSKRSPELPRAGVPLTLRDPFAGRQLGFRCSL